MRPGRVSVISKHFTRISITMYHYWVTFLLHVEAWLGATWASKRGGATVHCHSCERHGGATVQLQLWEGRWCNFSHSCKRQGGANNEIGLVVVQYQLSNGVGVRCNLTKLYSTSSATVLVSDTSYKVVQCRSVPAQQRCWCQIQLNKVVQNQLSNSVGVRYNLTKLFIPAQQRWWC